MTHATATHNAAFVVTGIDFENAHDAVVKLAQHTMQTGAIAASGVSMPQAPMMMQGPPGSHMIPGMPPHDHVYAYAPGSYGMTPSPLPPRPRF